MGRGSITFRKAGLLDKLIYLTFQTEDEGDVFARKLEAPLDRGIVQTRYGFVVPPHNKKGLEGIFQSFFVDARTGILGLYDSRESLLERLARSGCHHCIQHLGH